MLIENFEEREHECFLPSCPFKHMKILDLCGFKSKHYSKAHTVSERQSFAMSSVRKEKKKKKLWMQSLCART